VNIGLVMSEIRFVPNSVVSEPALPDFSPVTTNAAEGVRVAAFDELNCMFERHVVGWRE
jgi:hypothetical protein